MTLGSYLLGWTVLAAFVGPLGWAAVEVRRWVLGGWRGPWARLAEAVATAASVTVVAEALGTVGALCPISLAAAGLVGGAAAAGLRRVPRRPCPACEPPRAVDGWSLAIAGVVVGAVTAQWLAFTALAFRQGITAYDALFYHGAVAARFAQTGSVSALHNVVPGEAVAFYPSTTEVWHAVGILAFHSDLASPLVNLAALIVALLAAWCLGRHLGGAPGALAGVALVATVPYVALSQPGSSFNDIPAVAALLAAVALLLRLPTDRPPAAFAAAATGLAMGIKLSFLAPGAFMVIGASVLAPRGRRLVALGRWGAVTALTGGYWYARNLLRAGSPLPALRIPGLASPALPVDERYGRPLLASLSGQGWAVYHAGLRAYSGRAWPILVAMVVLAVALGAACLRRSPAHALLAAIIGASLLAYAVTPGTGDVAFFGFNLRYTLGIQALAACVLTTLPFLVGRVAQRLLTIAALAGAALAWPGPPPGHRDLFEAGAWPAGGGHRLAAVTAATAILALATAVWGLWRLARIGHRPVAGGAALLATASVAAVVAAGWGVAQRYQAHRYRHLGGELGAAWAWAQGVRDARIGVAGVYQQYPFSGPDVSNVVQYVGVPTPHHGFARAPSCAAWRAAVTAGDYRYVVTSRDGIFPPPGEPPEAGWTRSDPRARQILRIGATAVFALDGPLDPATC